MAGTVAASASPVPPASWSGGGRISSTRDVDRALAAVQARTGRSGTGELRRPVASAGELEAAGPVGHHPVHPLLAPLLPWSGGLRRGAVVTVSGAMSLLFAVLAPIIGAGGWASVVGAPDLGLVAASEHVGLELARVALVPAPGPDWPAVVAALLDGLDVVAVRPPAGAVPAGLARPLAARARRSGALLVPLTRTWPAADVALTGQAHAWAGLGDGHGRPTGHELRIRVVGRGAASRPREAVLPLPLPDPVAHPLGQRPATVPGHAARRSA